MLAGFSDLPKEKVKLAVQKCMCETSLVESLSSKVWSSSCHVEDGRIRAEYQVRSGESSSNLSHTAAAEGSPQHDADACLRRSRGAALCSPSPTPPVVVVELDVYQEASA